MLEILGSRAARRDERAHAEDNKDQQQDGHCCLLFDGDGMRELDAAHHLDVVEDAFGGAEKAEQADGDGDVHGEHALFGVVSEGEEAEDDEDDSDDRWDERGRRMERRGEKSYQAEQNKDYAEHNGELCHAKTCLRAERALLGEHSRPVCWMAMQAPVDSKSCPQRLRAPRSHLPAQHRGASPGSGADSRAERDSYSGPGVYACALQASRRGHPAARSGMRWRACLSQAGRDTTASRLSR